MGSRGILAIVALVLVGVGGWFALRRAAAPDDTRAPITTAPVTIAPAAAPRASRAPTLESGDPLATDRGADAGASSPAAVAAKTATDDAFDAEARDSTWAPVTEAALRDRLATLRGGQLAGAECRQAQCRVSITATDLGGLGHAIADLESTHGLRGFATSIVQTAPEQRADGTVAMRVYATFDR